MDQAALAIERVRLVEDLEGAKRTAEADRLRTALLTSISHDLRTPLAAVLGAAGTLGSLSDLLDQQAKADLVATIISEAERLNRFIANLLDMTRLESGAVVPNTALYTLGEVVGSAVERASKILA
jgi:two-component system, OmpR family, sensor histidine kinase KdpD